MNQIVCLQKANLTKGLSPREFTAKNITQGNKKLFIISNPPNFIILECKYTFHPVPKLRTPPETLTPIKNLNGVINRFLENSTILMQLFGR